MPKRSKSSARWLNEHESDPFVKAARAAGLRSRAAFKLEEIQQTDRVLKPGMTVVDLGAAPGGWCQIAAPLLGRKGRLIATDILSMEPIDGVDFVQGDFSTEQVLGELLTLLGPSKAQLVMSDMAPNMSGIASVDHLRIMHLVELAMDFAERSLASHGDFLVKIFQGSELPGFVKQLRGRFDSVKVRKPKASRNRSSEVYLLARNFRMV
jgi:23S rRNA (uridine2552-2'-O)-methyltransferase